MQGKHPIDERFRQALYHGEADPPEAVRTALGAHLGWTSAPRTNGAWWPMVLVAVGLIGTGAALWAWQDDPSALAMTGDHPVAQQRAEEVGSTANGAERVAPSNSTTAATTTDQGTSISTRPNGASGGQQGPALGSAAEKNRSTTNTAQHNNPATSASSTSAIVGTKVAAGLSTGNEQRAPSSPGRDGVTDRDAILTREATVNSNNATGTSNKAPAADQHKAHGSVQPSASAGVSDPLTFAQDQRSIMMDPLRIAPGALVPGGTPVDRALPPNYVLPPGTWWIGPYVGIGTVQGKWKGADAAALEEAEQWRSTAQGGLLIGHAWRSGWGVSMGLGVARVRSTFEHSDAIPSSSVLEVDTTWGTTMHTSGDILYSWQIDSLLEEVPGGLVRKDARNLYAAIQVPLLLHWHADARRLRYGAFGGFTAWIPTQRTGLTLAISQQDGQPTTLPLQDAKVDERFSTQVHGVAGVSVGYTITEHLSAFAEPMISAPLFSFDGGNMPWLTRPLLQFRLQYELRSKGR